MFLVMIGATLNTMTHQSDDSGWRNHVWAYCFCIKKGRLCANGRKADEWKRDLHLELHDSEDTMCPDIKRAV